MEDLDKILNNLTIGTLNETSIERFGLVKDKYSYNDISFVTRAIQNVYEKFLNSSPKGPYKAVCLASSMDPVKDVPGVRIPSSIFKVPSSGYLIKVIARIEELHAAIPKPVLEGAGKLNSTSQRDISILLHPVFYSFVDSVTDFPSPGNIVSVDFMRSSDKSYGIYLGMIDSNIRASMSSYVSTKQLMEDSQETTLGSF